MIEIRKPDEMLAKILPPVTPRTGIMYIPSQYALPFEQGGKAVRVQQPDEAVY